MIKKKKVVKKEVTCGKKKMVRSRKRKGNWDYFGIEVDDEKSFKRKYPSYTEEHKHHFDFDHKTTRNKTTKK